MKAAVRGGLGQGCREWGCLVRIICLAEGVTDCLFCFPCEEFCDFSNYFVKQL